MGKVITHVQGLMSGAMCLMHAVAHDGKYILSTATGFQKISYNPFVGVVFLLLYLSFSEIIQPLLYH